MYLIPFQDRVGHSGSGFPGGPRTPVSDFQPPYFPPPFGGQQPTAQEVFAAAQAPHLAAAAAATADPYTNSALHNFQTSQVSAKIQIQRHKESVLKKYLHTYTSMGLSSPIKNVFCYYSTTRSKIFLSSLLWDYLDPFL